MQAPHVVSAISALTPFGTSVEACVQALDSGSPLELRELSAFGRPSLAAFVADHDVRALLGTRSISQLDRLSRHVGISIRMLLASLDMADPETRRPRLPDERIGIVTGTTGALQSLVDYEREAIRDPRYVQPSLMPNMVLNVPASYAAIRHAIRGTCITLTDGPTSALKALAMGLTQLRCDHVDLMLCGGAEEATPAVALVHEAGYRQRQEAAAPALVEGAIFLALERRDRAEAAGRQPLLAIDACLHHFVAERPDLALRHCLDRLGHQTDLTRVHAVHAQGPATPALAGTSVTSMNDRLSTTALHTGSLGTMLSLLDCACSSHLAPGTPVLVTESDVEGNAAAVLVHRI